MKKFSLFLGAMLLVMSLGLYGCTIGTSDTDYASDAYVVLDINPSVEILTDEDGLVSQVNALNEDAEILLVDTNYVGKTVEETVEAIVALAVELGYLDFTAENAIVVTAAGGTEEDTEELETKIRDRIRDYANSKGMSMEVIQARQEATAEMIALAESLGISVGKLKLIQLAMQFDETLTLEVGATMAVKDLNAIVKSSRQEMKEFIGEQLRDRFMEFRQESRGEFAVSRIQFIYDAMLVAEVDFFAPVLTESTATAADVIALYEQYLNAVKAIEIPLETEEVIIEEEATSEIESNTEFEALLTQRQTKIQEMIQIRAQLAKVNEGSAQEEQLKTQLQTKWQEFQGLSDEIDAYKEQLKNQFKGTHNGFEFGIHEGVGEVEVTAQFDWINTFRAVRVEYEEKFAAINVSLTDLEALFHEIVEPQLATVRAEYQAEYGALKEEVKGQVDALREQYRQSKDNTRGMWGK
ncbi:MAG: hypothetical protein AB7V00_04655 [Bacilli bacterium]